MLLTYKKKSRIIPSVVRLHDLPKVPVMVPDKVKVGNDVFTKVSYRFDESIHPIPPEITRDMFSVKNLSSDAKRVTHRLNTNSLTDVYNSYMDTLHTLETVRILKESKKPVEPVKVESAPVEPIKVEPNKNK